MNTIAHAGILKSCFIELGRVSHLSSSSFSSFSQLSTEITLTFPRFGRLSLFRSKISNSHLALRHHPRNLRTLFHHTTLPNFLDFSVYLSICLPVAHALPPTTHKKSSAPSVSHNRADQWRHCRKIFYSTY